MNSDEIRAALRNVRGFDGVYSADTLPPPPHLSICNTKSSDDIGEHWVCVSINSSCEGTYFDSYGLQPPPILREYMNTNCVYWTFNRKRIQSVISHVCGHYCILYVLLRLNGFSMSSIVASFTDDTAFNDVITHQIVCTFINR